MIKQGWVGLMAAFLCSNLFAKSLGTIGETFKVAEMSFLKFIELRLKTLMHSSSMHKIQDEWVNSVTNYAKHPPSLGLPKASHAYQLIYDPSLVLTRDIRDASGRILYFKGHRVNALSHFPDYQPHWLFLDADDGQEMAYAKKLLQKYPDLKVILTQGEIEKTADDLNQAVFFDQGGRITQKLGIKEVPAFVERASNVLSIQVGLA